MVNPNGCCVRWSFFFLDAAQAGPGSTSSHTTDSGQQQPPGECGPVFIAHVYREEVVNSSDGDCPRVGDVFAFKWECCALTHF